MDNNNFKKLMSLLAEQYNRNVTPLMAKAYWQVLKEHTDEQVEQAVMAYIGDPDVCNFWPQPGAIKAKIIGTEKQQQTAITDNAQEAWLSVLKKMREQGAYGEIKLKDKIALKAIKLMGGWRDLCHTPSDKMEWRRKEFIETYRNSINAGNLPESIAGIGAKEQQKVEAYSQLKQIQEKANVTR